MRNVDAKNLGDTLFAATGDKIDPVGDTTIVSVSEGYDSTYSIQIGGRFPSREQINHFFAGLSGLANEINMKGAGLNWDSTQTYSHPSFVNYNGNFYFSLQDSLNQLPGDSNSLYWLEVAGGTQDVQRATETVFGTVRLAAISQILNGSGDRGNVITLAGLLERTPLATESRNGLTKLATEAEVNSSESDVAVSPFRMNNRLSGVTGDYYTRSYINNNYYTKSESDGRYLRKSDADNLYRQDSLYTGPATVNSNGALQTLNVSAFSASDYRWIEISYSNSGRIRTGRYLTSQLVQNLTPGNFPSKGLQTNNGRLNVWRTPSSTNTQLIFNLVGASSSYIIEEVIGIP